MFDFKKLFEQKNVHFDSLIEEDQVRLRGECKKEVYEQCEQDIYGKLNLAELFAEYVDDGGIMKLVPVILGVIDTLILLIIIFKIW